MKRPFETWILYLLLALLSINAFYGGISLILAPDGSLLGMQPGWLDKSPFSNYFVPGILLTVFMGIFPLITLFGLLTKNQNRFFNLLNIYPEKNWGWTFSLYCGITTNIWIIVQQLMAEYFILQTMIAAVGLLILIATLLPRVMWHYTLNNKKTHKP